MSKVAKNIKAAKAASGRKTIKAASGKKKRLLRSPLPPSVPEAPAADIIDRLWTTVMGRRNADPSISHSARLLSRGTAKVAQKFGEEAVECLIEAVAKNPEAVVAESADVLYHLVVLWVAAGVEPGEVWSELHRRQGLSGLAEKASRLLRTTKIP